MARTLHYPPRAFVSTHLIERGAFVKEGGENVSGFGSFSLCGHCACDAGTGRRRPRPNRRRYSRRLARKVDWTLKNGEPNKMKVQRKLKKLEKHKLVTNDRDQWSVT